MFFKVHFADTTNGSLVVVTTDISNHRESRTDMVAECKVRRLVGEAGDKSPLLIVEPRGDKGTLRRYEIDSSA